MKPVHRQDWHSTAVSDPFTPALLARPQLSFLKGLSHECLELAPKGITHRPSRLCIVRINTAQQATALLGSLPDAWAVPDDVAVVNFGLWYHDKWEYTKALHNFARHVRLHAARLPLMLWMETTAQHFDTPGGEWPPQYKPPFVCKPLQGLALGPGGGLVATGGMTTNMATLLAGLQLVTTTVVQFFPRSVLARTFFKCVLQVGGATSWPMTTWSVWASPSSTPSTGRQHCGSTTATVGQATSARTTASPRRTCFGHTSCLWHCGGALVGWWRAWGALERCHTFGCGHIHAVLGLGYYF